MVLEKGGWWLVQWLQRTPIENGDVYFLIKIHIFHLVCIGVDTNVTCSRLRSRDSAWVGLFARRAIFAVRVRNNFCRLPSASCLLSVKSFLSLDLPTFEVPDLGKLWTDMELMCPLTEQQRQWQRSLCFHQVSELFRLHFLRASLWLRQFIFGRP